MSEGSDYGESTRYDMHSPWVTSRDCCVTVPVSAFHWARGNKRDNKRRQNNVKSFVMTSENEKWRSTGTGRLIQFSCLLYYVLQKRRRALFFKEPLTLVTVLPVAGRERSAEKDNKITTRRAAAAVFVPCWPLSATQLREVEHTGRHFTAAVSSKESDLLGGGGQSESSLPLWRRYNGRVDLELNLSESLSSASALNSIKYISSARSAGYTRTPLYPPLTESSDIRLKPQPARYLSFR